MRPKHTDKIIAIQRQQHVCRRQSRNQDGAVFANREDQNAIQTDHILDQRELLAQQKPLFRGGSGKLRQITHHLLNHPRARQQVPLLLFSERKKGTRSTASRVARRQQDAGIQKKFHFPARKSR